MVPDRLKTPPAHELLKRFHGARFDIPPSDTRKAIQVKDA